MYGGRCQQTSPILQNFSPIKENRFFHPHVDITHPPQLYLFWSKPSFIIVWKDSVAKVWANFSFNYKHFGIWGRCGAAFSSSQQDVVDVLLPGQYQSIEKPKSGLITFHWNGNSTKHTCLLSGDIHNIITRTPKIGEVGKALRNNLVLFLKMKNLDAWNRYNKLYS